jgi:hypothetical protein
MMTRSTCATAVLVLVTACHAQTIDPFYAGSYSLTSLGSVPGVPTQYGGLTLKHDDYNVLLIGGAANQAVGKIYAIGVVRGVGGHITGFSGAAVEFAEAAYNDGGVTYIPDFIPGPDDVLFCSRWPVNGIGQIKPGSTVTDKVIDLGALGVASSNASNNFVPQGFPGVGHMKLCSWGGGEWYDAQVTPDGAGTYDIVNVTPVPASTLPGGPEGFAFVPPGSPLFTAPSIIVSEYSAGQVATYELDVQGDPVIATRRTFMTGLNGAEGAHIDPVTGDFLFSTFGGGNQVVVVQGFTAVPCYPNCNGDFDPITLLPILDIQDFGCFTNKFILGDPYADCNNDGILDISDFGCFTNAFINGC